MDTPAAIRPGRRPDWRVATALSVIPGLGQAYNGQMGKALRLLASTVTFVAGPVSLLVWAVSQRADYFDRPLQFMLLSLGSITVFLLGFVAGLFLWASAAVDARSSALTIGRGEDARRISFFRL